MNGLSMLPARSGQVLWSCSFLVHPEHPLQYMFSPANFTDHSYTATTQGPEGVECSCLQEIDLVVAEVVV